MEAVKVRKSTASRLDNALLERLKTEAKRENRSLNSLVEAILMDAMYCCSQCGNVGGYRGGAFC